MPLLSVENLRTAFHTRNGVVRAVNDVSFHVEKGETLGIVGESGSGKSVTCYSLMGLIPQPPGRIESGRAMFDGVDLLHCSKAQLAEIRGKRIAMIFQDPMTSLNPYLRVGEQIIEPLIIHGGVSRADAIRRALGALREVGIHDGQDRMRAYPHQFSGGMRQRVMIAMALITNPELVIADEPTTALDVTVQAQILELIKKLQTDHGTAVVFITHDLGVVSGFCDRVQVMYAGASSRRRRLTPCSASRATRTTRRCNAASPRCSPRAAIFTRSAVCRLICPGPSRAVRSRRAANTPAKNASNRASRRGRARARVRLHARPTGTLQLADTPLEATAAARIDEAFTDTHVVADLEGQHHGTDLPS